jgi:hypothetical protein
MNYQDGLSDQYHTNKDYDNYNINEMYEPFLHATPANMFKEPRAINYSERPPRQPKNIQPISPYSLVNYNPTSTTAIEPMTASSGDVMFGFDFNEVILLLVFMLFIIMILCGFMFKNCLDLIHQVKKLSKKIKHN